VPGVDGCFIGPNDLSRCLKGRRNEEHAAALLKVREAGRKVCTPVGRHRQSPQEVVQRIEQGFQLLTCQNDVAFMTAASSAARKQIRGG
jgi:2-keto-3-deoxy-L-rhamnonate aldolase RhmA